MQRKRKEMMQSELTIISLMDVLTTLLFFLLATSSFSQFAILTASSMSQSASPPKEDKPKFSLQIAMSSPNDVAIFLGPAAKLPIRDKARLYQYLSQNFKGNENIGWVRQIRGPQAREVLARVQETLKVIKLGFPHENQAVVVFADPVPYQETIEAISAVRSLPDTDPGFRMDKLTGGSELTRVLFPEIVVSEMEGDLRVAGRPMGKS